MFFLLQKIIPISLIKPCFLDFYIDFCYNIKVNKHFFMVVFQEVRVMSVGIITDSTSDFLKSHAENRNIEIANLKITVDGKDYIDGEDLTHQEFYDLMRVSKEIPKTSQVTPDRFMEIFEKALQKYDEVIGIFISSDMSGTYQSACIARDSLECDGSDRIHIIDSRQTTYGLQILVDIAADLRDEGKTAEEIVPELEKTKNKIHLYAMIDDLKNLKKGGRTSLAGLVIGTAFHIKPVITVTDGKSKVISKLKGKKNAIQFMCKQYIEKCADFSKPIYVAHTDCVELLNQFKDALTEVAGSERKFVDAEVGATIATHVGLGCIGFAQIEK